MNDIQASNAKAHAPKNLDAAEDRETFRIACHEHSVAQIVSETNGRKAEIDKAIANIRALRHSIGKITVAEILSSRHEGHTY